MTTFIAITLKHVWTNTDKYCIDSRMGQRGQQSSGKRRVYETRVDDAADYYKEHLADIRANFSVVKIEII